MALVQQVRAHSAADVRPALRKVAEQFRAGRPPEPRIVIVHLGANPRERPKVPLECGRPRLCRNILRKPWPAFPSCAKKRQETAIFLNWHAHCYNKRVHLVPRHEGAVAAVLWSPAPPLPLFRARTSCGGSKDLLKLAAFEHLHHDVGSADELTLHIQLWDGWPIGIILDALSDFGVLQDVDRFVFRAKTVENGDRSARKAALREKGGTLHEKHHLIVPDDLADAGMGITHC